MEVPIPDLEASTEAWHARLAPRLEAVRERIAAAARRAGRDPDEVTLVAVLKGRPPAAARAVHDLGVRHLAENRVQEARRRREVLGTLPGALWHLIGPLQRNKIVWALRLFDRIDSVDRLSLARELSRRAVRAGIAVPVLLEVNVGREPQKHGFWPQAPAPEGREALEAALEEILSLPGLRVEGLMTVPPLAADPEAVRPYFRALRQLRDRLAARYPQATWARLSMGMSADFEVAVEEGATEVRLGRILFEG